MFVFGARLAGRDIELERKVEIQHAKEELERERERQRELEIDRLQDEERRLLEELENTRDRLANEWEEKVKAGDRVRTAVASELALALSPVFGVPSRGSTALNSRERSIQSATGPPPSSASRPETFNFDTSDGKLLPILASDASFPFDAAAIAQSDTFAAPATYEPASRSSSPDAFPKFRLPEVTSRTKFVRRIPRQLGDEEKRRALEQERDEEEIMRALGLSRDEFEEFEGRKSSTRVASASDPTPSQEEISLPPLSSGVDSYASSARSRAPSAQSFVTGTPYSMPPPPHRSRPDSFQLGTPSSSITSESSFYGSRPALSSSGSRAAPFAPSGTLAEQLRRELGDSIAAVQHFTERVQTDISKKCKSFSSPISEQGCI